MAGENQKPVADMTEEELAALTPEQLEELQGNNHQDDGDDPGAAAGATVDDDDGLDAEAVAALAAEGEGSKFVPHSRFHELNERYKEERAARERAEAERARLLEAALGKGQPAAKVDEPPPYDFKKARREYQALLLTDPDAAIEKMDEIEAARDAQHKAELAKAAQEAEERAYRRASGERVTQAAEAAAEAIYEDFPFLNPNDASADEDAIYAVIGKRNQLIHDGMEPIKAMRKAAKDVGGKFAKLLGVGAAGGDGKSTPANAGGASTRQAAAVQRGAKTAASQPPTPNKGGVGNRAESGTLDFSKLSDEQIAKLSPEELKKARGDFRIPA